MIQCKLPKDFIIVNVLVTRTGRGNMKTVYKCASIRNRAVDLNAKLCQKNLFVYLRICVCTFLGLQCTICSV